MTVQVLNSNKLVNPSHLHKNFCNPVVLSRCAFPYIFVYSTDYISEPICCSSLFGFTRLLCFFKILYPRKTSMHGFSMCVCRLSHFSCVLLFATPWTVTHHSPLSMAILQARILEEVAIRSFRVSSQPRDQTHVFCISCIAGGFFTD